MRETVSIDKNEYEELKKYKEEYEKLKKDRYHVIYVGELNTVTGNNGLVTSTFDIKEIYNEFQNLTIDNFVYKVNHMYDHWGTNCSIIGGKTLKQVYDAENGILTVKNAYQISNFNSGFYGSVYLIPHINEIDKTL